jgi:hypothetical protein
MVRCIIGRWGTRYIEGWMAGINSGKIANLQLYATPNGGIKHQFVMTRRDIARHPPPLNGRPSPTNRSRAFPYPTKGLDDALRWKLDLKHKRIMRTLIQMSTWSAYISSCHHEGHITTT